MTGSDLVDRILSISAIVSALAAVVIALYEAHIDREYQKISVWPYVSQYNVHLPREDYFRDVKNAGLGPARVRSVQVRVDDRPAKDWGEVLERLVGRRDPPSFRFYGSLGRGSIILPGDSLIVLALAAGEEADRFHGAADRMSMRICYCSLFEECWLDDSRAPEPAPVEECPDDPELEFSM